MGHPKTRITMAEARNGLYRFHVLCKPRAVSWGMIWRTGENEAGLAALDRFEKHLAHNVDLAEEFLDNFSPSRLEQVMVEYFVEAATSTMAMIDDRRRYIRRVMDLELSLEERLDRYDQGDLDISADEYPPFAPF